MGLAPSFLGGFLIRRVEDMSKVLGAFTIDHGSAPIFLRRDETPIFDSRTIFPRLVPT